MPQSPCGTPCTPWREPWSGYGRPRRRCRRCQWGRGRGRRSRGPARRSPRAHSGWSIAWSLKAERGVRKNNAFIGNRLSFPSRRRHTFTQTFVSRLKKGTKVFTVCLPQPHTLSLFSLANTLTPKERDRETVIEGPRRLKCSVEEKKMETVWKLPSSTWLKEIEDRYWKTKRRIWEYILIWSAIAFCLFLKRKQ